MPHFKRWLDPFAALQELRAFLARRSRATCAVVTSWLGRVGRLRRRAKRARSSERDPRLEKAALELRPLDLRNPPSDNIVSAALPLAATAAAVSAAVYMAATFESHDRNAGLVMATERVDATAYDATPAATPALSFDADAGRWSGNGRLDAQLDPLEVPGLGATADELLHATASDGEGSTLNLPHEDWNPGKGGGAVGDRPPQNTQGESGAGSVGAPANPAPAVGNSASTPGSTNASGSNVLVPPSASTTGTATSGTSDGTPVAATTATVATSASSTAAAVAAPAGPAAAGASPTAIVNPPLLSDSSQQPVAFVQNAGQWAAGVDFEAQSNTYQTAISLAGMTVALPAGGTSGTVPTPMDAVSLNWTGTNPGSTAQGVGSLAAVSNFLIGNDPAQWHTGVAEYSSVQYANAWNGVNLVYTQGPSGQVEYNLVVQPGASAAVVGFTVQGASASIGAQGQLVLTTASGTQLIEQVPTLYQTAADGSRQAVTGGFAVRADGSIGFTVGEYDSSRALVIDPVLGYAATFGGSSVDVAKGVALDSSGNAYVVGYTDSSNFPVSTTAYDATFDGIKDAFVTKLGPTGSVVWSTYLGGSSFWSDAANAVALRSDGTIIVTGSTNQTDFPTTTGAYQTTIGGGTAGFSDAFLTALSASGSSLVYSTYLGGSGNDFGDAVAIDPATNQVVVVGSTGPAFGGFGGGTDNFPTTAGAYQTTFGGGASNAFVSRLNATATGLVYSTYLGGSGTDAAYGVALDAAGNAFVVGQTSSSNFPTFHAYDATLDGSTDAFVSEFTTGGGLEGSTLYGGSGNEAAYAVAVDPLGHVDVTGSTTSTDLPTVDPVQASYGGGASDAFVAQFNSLSYAPAYATYQGGSGADVGYGIAADAADEPVVVGTDGTNLTLTRYAASGTATNMSNSYSSATGFAAAVNASGVIAAAGTNGSDAVALTYGPPATPAVTGGPSGVTNNNTPTVSGTAPAGSTVSVYGTSTATGATSLLGTATASGSGLWTYTLSAMSSDGTTVVTTTDTVSGSVSAVSVPLTVTLDTAAPTVTVAVVSQTYDRAPAITVTASDLSGISPTATVALDVDLNGNGNFTDPGETNFMVGTLVNDTYTFNSSSYPSLLAVGVTAHIQARVLNLAGTQGTSGIQSVTVNTSPTTWTATSLTSDVRGGYNLSYGFSNPTDVLQYAGDVTTSYALALNVTLPACGCQDPSLVYNSQQANPVPVVQAEVQSNNALSAVPTQVLGTLVWDGTVSGTMSYNVSQLSPGSAWVFGAEPTSGLTTGRHTYELDLFINNGTGGTANCTITGDMFVVNGSSSPYGAGWSFSNTDALVTIASSGSYPAGVLRLYGKGGWSFYAASGGGYTSPAGDAGTLASTGGGGWTYTAYDGEVETFDSSGRMTNWTSPDGTEVLTYTYTGSGTGTAAQVATMTSPDGGVATFVYSGGLLSAIQAPGSRTTTFTMSSGNLVTIADPTSVTQTFAYSSNRLTGQTALGATTAYTYSNGLAQTVQVGTDPVGTVVAALAAGLGTASKASAQGGVGSTYTDARGGTSQTWYNSFGQPIQILESDGGQQFYTRNSNGYVTSFTDELNRTTTYTVNAAGQVTKITEPDSTTASYAYAGADGALSSYTDFLGGLWTYTSDAYGRMTSMENPLDEITTYSYSSGLLQTVTDALGQVTTYLYDASRRLIGELSGGAVTGTTGYDSAGNPNTFTDALGNITTAVYDADGRVISVTDPLGDTTTLTYSTTGQLLSTTDPNGNVTSYGYDASGRWVTTIQAYGTSLAERTTTVYDANGNLIATVDALGNRSTYVYDTQSYGVAGSGSQGHRIAIDPVVGSREPSGSAGQNRLIAMIDPLGNRTTMVYDLAGEVVATIDPLGRVTKYGYDAQGRPVSVTDALGNTTTIVYDANSNVIAVVDPLSNRTTGVYDAANELIAVVDPLGNRTSYGYDLAGKPVTVKDPLGNVTTTVYDSRNRVIATIDALGNTTTTVYDADDRAVATIDPLGNRTTMVYDNASRLVATEDALSNYSTTVYDADGNAIATVDPLGNRTTSVFDALNRQIATVDALGNRSTVVYDADNRVIATIDPLGNRSTIVYDADSRVVATEDALGNFTTNIYDAASNVIASEDALGHITSYTVDGLNRVIATTDPLGNVSSVTFDAAGRQVTSTDARGNVTTSVYDADGRQTATIDALGNRSTTVYDAASNVIATIDPLSHTTTSVYDADNRQIATVDALGNRSTTVYDAAGNVIATVDPLGNRTTSVYDADNRQIATVDALGNRSTTVYDAASNVIATVDPLGNRTTVVYDADNRAIATVDALGNRSTTTYDAAGNVKTTVDARGDTTTYGYDARNMQVTTTDALGNVWTTQYDALGQVRQQIDPLGNDTLTYFDADGRVIQTTDGLRNPTATTYDANGNVIATTDALGRTTTNVYDADNRVVSTKNALSGIATTTYNAAGNVIAQTDQLNHTTSYAYDADNRLVTTTDALGNVSTTAYDAAGNVIAQTDALNHTTTSVYDALNRVIATVDPLGNRTTTAYDAAGNMIASIDPLSHTTTTVYDADNRQIATVDSLGNRTTTAYDAAGNAIAVTDARGYTTTSTYDADNRVIAVTDALSHVTSTVYDAAGNVIATVDALGDRTTSVFDADNRVIATVDPLGDRTSTGYDAVGNVVTTTDPLGRTTSYGYDALNRQITTTDPLGHVTTSIYDAGGNRTVLIDADNNRTTWAYDADNRVTTETDPTGVSSTYAYNAIGLQTSETDPDGRRIDDAYDADNRVLTEKWYASGGSFLQTLTWTYDAAGNMLTAQAPAGSYTLAYDADNRVTSVQEPFSLVLTFGYDADGDRTSVQDSKGGVTTVTFDALDRQLSQQTSGTGISAMRFDYAYTARGQVASLTQYSDLAGTTVVATTSYDYDAAGRETHQKQTNGSGTVLANYTYTYDAASELTAKQENGTTTSYSYDADGELTADGATTYSYDNTGNRTNTGYATGTGNETTTDGTSTYTYDNAGNVIQSTVGASGATWVYTYNNANQMVGASYSATLGGTVTEQVTYVYDAYGNRIEEDVWNGSTTTVTRFGMDGWDPAQPMAVGTENFNTWADLDGSNNLTMRRQFGTGFDDLIARQTSGGTVLWYLTDNQSSVRQLVNNSGAVVGTLAYSAFGQVTTSSGTTDRYGYTGSEEDSALGLQYNRGRIYDPTTGKWMSVDPDGFAAGDANLYRYVGNSPTNLVDPSGYYHLVPPILSPWLKQHKQLTQDWKNWGRGLSPLEIQVYLLFVARINGLTIAEANQVIHNVAIGSDKVIVKAPPNSPAPSSTEQRILQWLLTEYRTGLVTQSLKTPGIDAVTMLPIKYIDFPHPLTCIATQKPLLGTLGPAITDLNTLALVMHELFHATEGALDGTLGAAWYGTWVIEFKKGWDNHKNQQAAYRATWSEVRAYALQYALEKVLADKEFLALMSRLYVSSVPDSNKLDEWIKNPDDPNNILYVIGYNSNAKLPGAVLENYLYLQFLKAYRAMLLREMLKANPPPPGLVFTFAEIKAATDRFDKEIAGLEKAIGTQLIQGFSSGEFLDPNVNAVGKHTLWGRLDPQMPLPQPGK